MLSFRKTGVIAACLLTGFFTQTTQAQTPEAAIVDQATNALNEIMAIPANKIPQSMLADACGIVIIPNMVKGGFVVGVRHGRGVVLTRDANGGWRPPMFVSMTGGSVGWQAGLQASDVILVFKTQKSINGLMSGKFTIGADAAAAAGPVGRQAAAATDARLGAEIYSYSRSRGLFAGVSVDGSALQVDPTANAVYYANTGLSPDGTAFAEGAQLPPSAVRLVELVARYTSAGGANAAVATSPNMAPNAIPATPHPAAQQAEEAIRVQLVQASQHLQVLLDDNWKKFLALPAEVYASETPVTPQALAMVLQRYETVAHDSRYLVLAQRPEFQATHQSLRAYLNSRTANANTTLVLPPPPGEATVTPNTRY